MPRKARLDAPGALHHIMVRGIDKTDIFVDHQDKTRFLERLDENVTEGKCSGYAWVLMDNHVHLLFKSGKYGISAVMRKLLTWYAQYFNRRHKRIGHLFQNRYKSILCDEENYLLALIRYIHLNPVSIIKKHEGMIDVESRVGSGTVFTIYLPASFDSARPQVRTGELASNEPVSGKILLMDDDDIVRETSGVMLNLLGYEVDFAVDGTGAIDLYKKAREIGAPYDVVIMDLTIRGGKGGKETIKDLLALDPKARAIVSSGYSNDAILANYAQSGFAGIIVKPYTMDELSDELRRVMAQKENSRTL